MEVLMNETTKRTKPMNQTRATRIFNTMRNSIIETKKSISINEKVKSNAVILDYMTEDYEYEHRHLIEFLRSKETIELLKSKVPASGKGYVQVYVKQDGESFETYGVEFKPYHIMHKYWGLGYQDTNPSEFIHFKCLFANDYTKFRGSIKI